MLRYIDAVRVVPWKDSCKLYADTILSVHGRLTIIIVAPHGSNLADLGIVSKEELKAYQIPEEGVGDNLTLKTKGAEILDSILI